ncbi:MAG: hypothetical protein QM736_06375 [Vicinamibacterales bacterium]
MFKSELWRGRDNLRVSLRAPFSWSTLPSALVPLIDIAMVVVTIGALVAAAVGWQPGLKVALVAAGVVVAGSVMKVVRSRRRDTRASLLATLVVAFVYDLARACALLTRAPHRGATRSSPVAAA